MDVGIDSVRLCQLRPLDERCYAVVAKTTIPFSGSRSELLASPNRLKMLLAQGMKRQGFIGRKVVTVMPPEDLKITPVTYKANAQNPDEEILKMLSSRVEGALTDYMIDYLPVRSNPGDEEHLALAAIARRDQVMEFLNALTRAGFDVEALDVGPAAIRRLVSAFYRDARAETILVINTGSSKSYLTIISGRRLLFDQAVDFGERLLLQRLANTLELSEQACRDLVFGNGLGASSLNMFPQGALAAGEVSQTLLQILKPAFFKLVEEINRVLIFTASETHGGSISRICLLGSIARWPGVESLLGELIDIPFSDDRAVFGEIFLDPAEGADNWLQHVPELAIATGLALRGLENHE
jgi:Tfp pilus assembly PilM family ATPase